MESGHIGQSKLSISGQLEISVGSVDVHVVSVKSDGSEQMGQFGLFIFGHP